MRQIVIQLDQFQPIAGNNYRWSEMLIHQLLDVMVFANAVLLRCHPEIPSIYELGRQGIIRYQREPPGLELFNGILQVIRDGGGDCDDLASARVAELQVRGSKYYPNGEPAKIHLVRFDQPGKGLLYHVQVLRAPTPEAPKGFIEDPSVVLGMPVPMNAPKAIVVPPPVNFNNRKG